MSTIRGRAKYYPYLEGIFNASQEIIACVVEIDKILSNAHFSRASTAHALRAIILKSPTMAVPSTIIHFC